MTPRPLALGLLAILAACAPSDPRPPADAPAAAPPASAASPIVLVSIDTLRSDHLPAYGYAGVSTPAIDALARDGVVFERAFAAVPLTLPSHASIFTGLLPPAHGVRDNIGYRLAEEGAPTLPQLLRGRGYATGAAVSALVLRAEGGLARGFDVYDDRLPPGRRRAGAGGVQRPGAETWAAIRPWLTSALAADAGRPVFLFLHLFEPHTPYAPPEPFASRYAASPYDGEIAAADAVVGELVAELRRLGAYESAAVVLLADHGEGLGEHGEEEHGILLYRESLQVPLVLKLPNGAHAGRRVATPVALVDVFPTVLELAGEAPPPDLAGASLLAHLGPRPPAPRPIYSETYFPRLHFGWSELTSIVDDRWHLIRGPDPELYDLDADPGETANRIRDERPAAARLAAVLAGVEGELQAAGEEDAATREGLAALGYVGSAPAGDGPRPDPKSRLATVRDLQEGLRLYFAGELDRAVAALRRAVAVNADSLDAWEYLGRSLQELRRPGEAVAAYERALDLAGGRATHLAAAAATILLENGRVDQALELLRREQGRSPDALSLRLLEGRTLLVAGRAGDALVVADEAVRQAPRNADAVYLRGAVAIGLGRLDAAEVDLRRALELAPGHTAALSDLAVLLAHRGEVDEARRLLERVLELRPGDPTALAGLQGLAGKGEEREGE